MTMRISHALAQGPFRIRTASSSAPISRHNFNLSSNATRVFEFGNHGFRFLSCRCSTSGSAVSSAATSSSPAIASNSGVSRKKPGKLEAIEEDIEKVIYRCRFLAILGVFGSLIGSFLCFIKGCTFVAETFKLYFIDRSKVILMLVEAIDVYLLGTVMLVFGMGLYELFVSNLGSAGSLPDQDDSYRSNLFGLFTLKERPKWLGIKTVNELKTKLGHVIVMLLLIGLFDKSKKAVIHTPVDLLCFSASVLLSSSCLFLLSKLNDDKELLREEPSELLKLPTDKALVEDTEFRKYVELYSEDEDAFSEDYAASHKKLSKLDFKSRCSVQILFIKISMLFKMILPAGAREAL